MGKKAFAADSCHQTPIDARSQSSDDFRASLLCVPRFCNALPVPTTEALPGVWKSLSNLQDKGHESRGGVADGWLSPFRSASSLACCQQTVTAGDCYSEECAKRRSLANRGVKGLFPLRGGGGA